MSAPWKEKENIDVALGLLDSAGFRVSTHHFYNGQICLLTKGNNEHGFSNDIVLEAFNDWREVIVFMAGWNKAMLAKEVAKMGRKKK